jgi:hypothetical protein
MSSFLRQPAAGKQGVFLLLGRPRHLLDDTHMRAVVRGGWANY